MNMAGIQVIAGSFPKGWASMGFGTISVCQKPKQGFPENIVLNLKEELLSIELADSEEESRIGKAAGAGLLGGLIFGGAGLVIGGLLGAADKTKKLSLLRQCLREIGYFWLKQIQKLL
ncbi:hypothetical protein ACVV38_15775 [Escherichia coli]